MRRSDRRLSDEDYHRVVTVLVSRAREWLNVARQEKSAMAWGIAHRTSQHRRAWMLMGEAGLRLAEACGLRWRDVLLGDEVVRTVRVSASVAKGGHEREVPTSDYLADALEEGWMVEREYAKWQDGRVEDLMRMSVLGCGRRQVERWIGNVSMQELGREIHPHALRHYAGNRWRRASGDIAVCQTLLGHVDVKTTMIYTNVGGQELVETVRRASQVGFAGGRNCS